MAKAEKEPIWARRKRLKRPRSAFPTPERHRLPGNQCRGGRLLKKKETLQRYGRVHHERRNTLINRTKALRWLNQSLSKFCDTLGARGLDTWLRNPIEDLKETLRESVDAALMILSEAIQADDEFTWNAAHQVTRDRSDTMSKVRSQYLAEQERLSENQVTGLLLATNAFEEVFHSIRRVEEAWNPYQPTERTGT